MSPMRCLPILRTRTMTSSCASWRIPASWLARTRSFSSSGECSDSLEAPGGSPTARSTRLPRPLSVTIAGRSRKRKRLSGRTIHKAVRSLRWSARLFGASSPRTICSVVMMTKATATAMACEPTVASDPGRLLSQGSIRWASTGSPIHPRARDEMVMPSWVAARLASRLSTARCKAAALVLPAAASSTTRLWRTATRENSAATKNPLAATRPRTASIPRRSKARMLPSGTWTWSPPLRKRSIFSRLLSLRPSLHTTTLSPGRMPGRGDAPHIVMLSKLRAAIGRCRRPVPPSPPGAAAVVSHALDDVVRHVCLGDHSHLAAITYDKGRLRPCGN